ncbi:hypothetical protein ACFSL6_11240 [Paenibacillus thailandensis]|uniref:MarR family transcriptional regulator n=1 Tax=Paenibacillus thailandensis TaxID=393250 RepID=A0ABW5QTJ3_9BACL
MDTKRCVFCDRIVPVRTIGQYEQFIGCLCAPGGQYHLLAESYDWYYALDYTTKREMFPIISAYIRELTEMEETVELSAEDLDKIRHSSRLPQTIEEKGEKLLQHLYRQSGGTDKPVVIHKLAESFNITYSLNLQEMVYIIEKLKEEELLERRGSTFVLTPKGIRTAKAGMAGQKLKPCCVLLSEELGQEWANNVLPKMYQCGYSPQLAEPLDGTGGISAQQLASSKLIIADLTGHRPEVYWAAGYAQGLQIPVIWTVHRSAAGQIRSNPGHIRPIVWEDGGQLAALLQQRLTAAS